ncbi:MAG TPA: hypothetical protein VFG23_03450 [Polyangia bacterium]|nr:hypothetical protein [Polyangia bacterium]
MNWLVDDGPLGLLALEFDPAWRWPASTLHVVEEVAAGAASDRSTRRTQLLQLKGADRPSVVVHAVAADSAAGEMLYRHLRPKGVASTKNIGEDVAIAFAATMDSEAVFVTMDKAAAYAALAELGPGRVASPFDLWAHLLDAGHVSKAQYDRLLDRTWKGRGLPGVPWRFSAGRFIRGA